MKKEIIISLCLLLVITACIPVKPEPIRKSIKELTDDEIDNCIDKDKDKCSYVIDIKNQSECRESAWNYCLKWQNNSDSLEKDCLKNQTKLCKIYVK